MKAKYTIIITILLMSFNMKAQTFSLTVNNGYGSGTFNEGDTIHVWVNPSFNDTVFTNWTGSGTNYLTFDNEWHTTLIVPSGTNVGSLTINANLDIIPLTTQIDSTSYLLFGEDANIITNVMKETFYAIPPSPKGVVFLLHGTNGSGASFFKKYERFNLVKDLVYDGYAVFTLDANEVTMGDQNSNGSLQWIASNAGLADTSNNVDIKNIASLKDTVISQFNFQSTIPCFTLGMSAGANFSDICASALNFNASAHVTAKGKIDTYTRVDIAPVIWILSDNDHNPSADNEVAFTNFSTMNAVQTAEYHLFKRSPVYSERFLRSLNNITQTQSDSVFQRLQTNGYLDINGFLTVLDVSLIPTSLLDNLGLTNEQKKDISQQLLCVNADHVLHSDYNKNIIRFFNQTLSPLSINENGIKNITVIVYPNPMSSSATIEFANSNNEIHTFKLFNILGKNVRTVSNRSNDKIEIRRENLKSGVYFFQLYSDSQAQTSGKLIIK